MLNVVVVGCVVKNVKVCFYYWKFFLLLKILFCLKFIVKFSEFMVMLDLRLFMVLGLWSFFVICKWCLSIIIVIDVINVY